MTQPVQMNSQKLDLILLLSALVLCLLGYVMITSASIDMAALSYGDAFYQSKRQLMFIFVGRGNIMVVFIYSDSKVAELRSLFAAVSGSFIGGCAGARLRPKG